MANAKKRPSKNAKATKKILENSKLLALSKGASTVLTENRFQKAESTFQNTTANKKRPDKKRG